MASIQYYLSLESIGYDLQEDLKKSGKDPATFHVFGYPVVFLNNFFGLITPIPFQFRFGQRFEVGHHVSFKIGTNKEIDAHFIVAMDIFLQQFSSVYPQYTRADLELILDEFLGFLLVGKISWDVESTYETTCTIRLKIDTLQYIGS